MYYEVHLRNVTEELLKITNLSLKLTLASEVPSYTVHYKTMMDNLHVDTSSEFIVAI